MSKKNSSQEEREKLTADIRVYVQPVLKELAGQMSDAKGIPLSELCAQAIAAFVGRPDLGFVPRKIPGRKRIPLSLAGKKDGKTRKEVAR